MNRLFPLPIYSFVKIAFKNGGFAAKRLKNLPSWLIKLVLFEPLRWVELAYNKKIGQHTISRDPVFVLGFYRSGTSYLHQFLTQDDRFGYHTNFQMVMPEIMLSSEKILSPFFEFICRIFNIQDSVHRKRLSFRFPGEEDVAMTTSSNPMGAHWGYFFPKKMLVHFQKYVLFENVVPAEIEKWERDFTFLIRKISLANKGRQLILKSPPNTARVKQLLSLFPKAKFIMIHRNPYEVYASNKRFWNVTRKVYALGGDKSVDVNAIIMDTYAKMMNRYFLEKELIPEGQLIEIPYEDFIQNPLENMRSIYEKLNLGNFSYCESKMRLYVAGQKSFARLEHELPANEKEQVSKNWEASIRRWNYPLI